MSQKLGQNLALTTRPHRASHLAQLGFVACWLLLLGLGMRPMAVRAQDEYPAPFVPEINPIDDGSNPGNTADSYPAPTAIVPGIIGSDAQPSQLDFHPL